jgi:outer membrane protein OmpA-like peptidoglycan-associated protein
MRWSQRLSIGLVVLLVAALTIGCASMMQSSNERTTKRDKTKKGAAIGAASGAVLAAATGEGELDEILAGAVIGAGVGAGVGAYMDHQEEKLARIPGTTVERVGDNLLLVRFESDILFSVNSATLNSGARTTLDEAADVFIEYRKTAIISQGHTDSSGSEEYNQTLSERRAASVANYLIGQGIDSTRVTAVGYGESQPVASNATNADREMNRRVDLLLKAKVQ